MKQIPNDSIRKWAYSNSNKLSHPVSVCAVCPGCSLNVVFNTRRRLYDPNRDTSSCSSDCPACGATAHFWVVDMVAHARNDGEGTPGVYMLPANASERMDIDDHQDTIPADVIQYCKTAQDIYFSGNLMASNVLIKTALETIFRDFLPIGNSQTDLSKMIRDSISTINHNEPLAALCASTGKQGDLHALFANHQGTRQETAEAMIKLLETLLLYLYIMPARFKELETIFSELKSAADAASDTQGSESSNGHSDSQSANDSSQKHDADDDSIDEQAA